MKEEGWTPNYILTDDGRRASRVNIICTVISKDDSPENKSIVVDDGSANIQVRTFEDTDPFLGLELGNMIMLVGRPREYGTQRYVIPEIIKKINDPKVIQIRQKELELLSLKLPKLSVKALAPQPVNSQPKTAEPETSDYSGDEAVMDDETGEDKERELTPSEKLCALIKEMDKGDGVYIQELIEKSTIENTENLITELISAGDIFEVRAGCVKVL